MAPDGIVVVLLAAAIAVTVAVWARAFTPWVVVPLFAVMSLVLLRFVPAPPSSGRSQIAGSVVSVLGAAAWAVANVPYAAQILWVGRDPGIYTLLGVWLGRHRSVAVDGTAMLDLAHRVPGTTVAMAPFAPDAAGVLHAQGGPALPGLLGVGAWLDGVDAVLKVNLAIGAVALVGTYGLARRFVHPWLALAAQAGLGLTVGFLYLMRAPYSESVMLIAAMAALLWLVDALATGRRAAAAVGGVFLGVASMARIDGPMALVGAAVLVAVAAVVVSRRGVRRLRQVGSVFLAAGTLSSLVGLAAIWSTEPRYVHDLRGQVMMLWAAAVSAVAAAVTALVTRVLLERRGRLLASDRALGRIGAVAGAAVPLVFVFWWSRPWWWQGHFFDPRTPYANAIAGMQARTGQPVDGTRSYDELTLHWMGWHLGWPTVVLAGVGLGLMLWTGLARRDLGSLAVVVPAGLASVLYFDKASITPDQVWAFRRLLPVITPGFLVAAVIVAEGVLRTRLRGDVRYGAAAVLALMVALGPLMSWNTLVKVPEAAGTREVTDKLCHHLAQGPDGVVLIAAGTAPSTLSATIKAVCGRDVVVGPASDPAYLRRVAAQVDHLQVVAFSASDLPPGTKAGPPTVTGSVRSWDHTLDRLPDIDRDTPRSIWIGHVVDARFVPDPPSGR